MDYQGHQMKAGGNVGAHGMDGISHRNLHGVQYNKPSVGHSIAKPQHIAEAKPVQDFKPQQVAQNQSDIGQAQDAVKQAAPQDATSLTGDQVVAPGSTVSTPTSYTIRAGDSPLEYRQKSIGRRHEVARPFQCKQRYLGQQP